LRPVLVSILVVARATPSSPPTAIFRSHSGLSPAEYLLLPAAALIPFLVVATFFIQPAFVLLLPGRYPPSDSSSAFPPLLPAY